MVEPRQPQDDAFDDDDIAAMDAALACDDLDDEDRFHLDFALGKASRTASVQSFRHTRRATHFA